MHRNTRKMQRVSYYATLWFRHELLGAHFTRRGAWFLSNTTNRIRYFCMKASPLPAYYDVHDGDSCISVLCDDAQNPLIQRCHYLCSCSVAKAKHAIPQEIERNVLAQVRSCLEIRGHSSHTLLAGCYSLIVGLKMPSPKQTENSFQQIVAAEVITTRKHAWQNS